MGLIIACIAWSAGVLELVLDTFQLQGSCLIWEQHKKLSSTSIWLFIRIDLSQSHSNFSSPPPPPSLLHVYSFIFISGLCFTKDGSFLALGYENMPVQASIGSRSWGSEGPINYLRVLYSLMIAKLVYW